MLRESKRGRWLQGSLVTAFFALMMGLLARDYVIPAWQYDNATPVNTAMLADQWSGRDEWMRIYVNRQEVGVIRTEEFQEGDHVLQTVKMRLTVGILRASINMATVLNSRLELVRVEGSVDPGDSGVAAIQIRGAVDGNKLLLEIKSPTGVKHHSLPLRGPITVNASMNQLMAGDNMEAGKTYLLQMYDPIWGMQSQPMRVQLEALENIGVGEKRFNTRRVRAELGGVTMRVWATDQGDQVRREIALSSALGVENPSGSPSQHSLPGQGALVMERMEPMDGMNLFPTMVPPLPVPAFTAADLEGEDSGEPLHALGILPMMFQGGTDLNSIMGSEGEEQH